MTPTKLLIGQITIIFAIVIAGVWAATQWAAFMLGYQAQLGEPWFIVDGLPVYHPWQLFPWWYAYDAYAPEVFDKAGMLAGRRRLRGVRLGDRRLAVAGAPVAAGHHLRLVALGDFAGGQAGRAVPAGPRVSRAAEGALSAS